MVIIFVDLFIFPWSILNFPTILMANNPDSGCNVLLWYFSKMDLIQQVLHW